jgi:hypothetical protein|tara:strand:- start:21 stop:254 length:234 start_codon:yes stop_codon:yes gene_type:complete
MKIQKNNLFATYKTQRELHEYFNAHTGPGETFLLTLGAGLMWNTIAHILEEEDENQTWSRNWNGTSKMKMGESKDQS